MPRPRVASARFWEKVEVRSEQECWIWTAARVGRMGYGHFWPGPHQRLKLAHRYAFELIRGCIPPGMQVLHRCDTPQCVNPTHLFLGTNDDNVRDKISKGRQPRGLALALVAPRRKLSLVDVADIRRTYIPGRGLYHRGNALILAERFGVGRGAIIDAAKGRTWGGAA
jgi:hypothetical protein